MKAIQEFMNENPVIFWLIVVAVVLIIVLIVLKVMDSVSKNKQKQVHEAKTTVVPESTVTPVEKPLKESSESVVKKTDLQEAKEETMVVKEEVKEPVKPIAEEPAKAEESKVKKPAKYHVSQNKDDDSEHAKMWRVRKAGSEKTIKFFKTQKEAIDFAQGLADSAGSSVVIHKVDGSIRKQNYTKKEDK